mmetsp:Transcript_43363/g.114683  ORF Transcript_43363/g.114683 Transcript_43363/m.114683 type:complete len:337 (-) Transcript_43363:257-1267(-)
MRAHTHTHTPFETQALAVHSTTHAPSAPCGVVRTHAKTHTATTVRTHKSAALSQPQEWRLEQLVAPGFVRRARGAPRTRRPPSRGEASREHAARAHARQRARAAASRALALQLRVVDGGDVPFSLRIVDEPPRLQLARRAAVEALGEEESPRAILPPLEAFLCRESRDEQRQVVRREAPQHEADEHGEEDEGGVDQAVELPSVGEQAERGFEEHSRVGSREHEATEDETAQADGHRHQEEDEELVVARADTIPCEGAVMVKVAHTIVAVGTVRRARWPVDAAGGAPGVDHRAILLLSIPVERRHLLLASCWDRVARQDARVGEGGDEEPEAGGDEG